MVNRNMATAVQEETVKQAASKSWFKIRAGRVEARLSHRPCNAISKFSEGFFATQMYISSVQDGDVSMRYKHIQNMKQFNLQNYRGEWL